MKNCLFLLLLFVIAPKELQAQEKAWFYLRTTDTLILPQFKKVKDQLKYTGNDSKLKQVLDAYEIYEFKKTYRKARRKYLKRTFFVMANSEQLLPDLLANVPDMFESGDVIPSEDKKIYEPNDYGLTSTIGANIGLQANLDYLDVLGLPEAWYYTTGDRNTIIGISDGRLDTLNPEFAGKSKQIRGSTLSKGHGIAISANAAAQGDNGYGIAGVCYDCSVYGTIYGDVKNYSEVQGLAELGARVVNCSWAANAYHDSGKAVIEELLKKGTVVVASGGNKKWEDTKGKVTMYPAGYDKVIAVSSVMHKYADVSENTVIIPKDNSPAFANIRGYVGRTGGFVDNDTTKAPKIYPVSVRTLNPMIDILTPTVDIVNFAPYTFTGDLEYNHFSTTSGASPFVSGTVGLIFSMAPCFPAEEVETVIKLTATNIDHIEANKPYAGNYGAGMLNTGRAVKMAYNMFAKQGNVMIENQQFSRWNLKLTTYSNQVTIKNQKFTEAARFDLKAKNQIVIGQNTVLRPNKKGSISLKIDPTLQKPCDLVLRDPSIPQ